LPKGRCYYCENEGAKIIHPDLEKYIGRDIGPVYSAYNPSFSACFFSWNNIFLSQQISQQYFSADLSAQPNGSIAFEGMACKSNVSKGSICDNDFIIDFVDICEDCIYFDASRDAKCAEFLNARAISMQRPRFV
jgi:hypothetical protein